MRQTFLWGCFTILWAMLTVPLIVLGILLTTPFLGPRKAFFTIGPLWARQMFWVSGITLERRGWEALPEAIRSSRQPVIFMSNHESQMDPPLLINAIPVPAVYIAKKEVKLIPFVGWAAMCAGVIWIDRGNRDRAIKSIQEAADKIRRGRNVVIFVEGTRTRTGELLPFKKGGFQLAMDAGVAIVPLATVGGYQTLPRGSMFVRPGRYVVSFGEPVDTASYTSRDELMRDVRARIESLIADARK
ncbi:MAG: 1-acyl-sn-glycerol-3-phosphate acyltransferase, partial [Acidobacteriota bacterium]|nr:1-acyl-sn-glycerol-3-phosphate acyltransferase [Acidobacteriota bacterium]